MVLLWVLLSITMLLKKNLVLDFLQKSEYVLVGTLLSFGIAIFLGVGIQAL